MRSTTFHMEQIPSFHVEHKPEPMKRYFITGTDTGVGKTFVTCTFAHRAREIGRRVMAFKPIETGVNGTLGEDQHALVEAAGGWQHSAARGLYQFAQPAAPLVAARAESRTIDVDAIKRVVSSAAGLDLLLVEGAGGLRVPVTETVDMAGLARALDLPLIVVARAGLGTINHSLLTIEAAEREGLRVAALVLSLRPDEDRDFAASNAFEIRRRWPSTVLVFDGSGPSLDMLL